MGSRMFSSNVRRLASPDLRARCSTGPGSIPEPTAVPTATAVPMLRKICTVDSAERSARSNFSNRASRCGVEGAEMSPLMTLSHRASSSVARATSAATMRLPRSLDKKRFGFLQRVGIEICRERAQARAPRRRRCEMPRFAAAVTACKLRVGQRRRGVALEQLANMSPASTPNEARTCSRMAAS